MVEKNFWLIAAEDRSQDIILDSLVHTHCSNLSFCLLFLIRLSLSLYLFSLFFVDRSQLYSPFLIIVRALTLTIVA